MSKRICILTPGQAGPLERQGKVPPCKWHHHCSESEGTDLHRLGRARIVHPASACRHPKPAIVLLINRDYRPGPCHIDTAPILGAPQLRTWQLVR
jgi:hypothetical protein